MKRIFLHKLLSSNTRGFAWLFFALAIAVLDQGMKYWVRTELPYGAAIELTPFFNLVHRWNPGAAFSFLANAGGWQRPFLIAFSVAVSVYLAITLRKRIPWHAALAYSFILGGALANATDRIARGYVTDYLDLHIASRHWPAFNMADMVIVAGVVSMVGYSIGGGWREEPYR